MQRKTTIKDALDLFLLDCRARRLTPSTQTFFNELDIDTLQDVTGVHVRAACAPLAICTVIYKNTQSYCNYLD